MRCGYTTLGQHKLCSVSARPYTSDFQNQVSWGDEDWQENEQDDKVNHVVHHSVNSSIYTGKLYT
jgi:hypothetical protein